MWNVRASYTLCCLEHRKKSIRKWTLRDEKSARQLNAEHHIVTSPWYTFFLLLLHKWLSFILSLSCSTNVASRRLSQCLQNVQDESIEVIAAWRVSRRTLDFFTDGRRFTFSWKSRAQVVRWHQLICALIALVIVYEHLIFVDERNGFRQNLFWRYHISHTVRLEWALIQLKNKGIKLTDEIK